MVLSPCLTLFRMAKSGSSIPDVEVRLQDVGDGLVGYPPAEGEAFAFQEGDVFIEHGLPELIEQTGLAHPCFGNDGDRLAPSLPGTLEGVKQELPFPFSANKGRQASLGTDIKPGTAGAGGDHPVDAYRVLLALDLLSPRPSKRNSPSVSLKVSSVT